MTQGINKIVLAYSGGLDTSVMLHWLKERYGCEVVCYCADVRIVTPPHPAKDARAWVNAGASSQDILDAVNAAPARRLAVRTRRVG